MPLAKRNNGCVECRLRRLRCDKAEPECFKCQKKGIKCSGQGAIEWRFSSHMKKRSSSLLPTSQGCITTRTPGAPKSRRGSAASNPSTGPSKDTLDAASPPIDSPSPIGIAASGYIFDDDITADEVLWNHDQLMQVAQPPAPQAALCSLAPRNRMLFDHFSNSIASKMVVFDFTGNGYRQLLLPLACQDSTVSNAVSVISAFHLSQKVPSMRAAAELRQQGILSKLRNDSLHLDPNHLFTLSTWAIVLVLLVGDTITGSNNYVYLLELLSRLAEVLGADPSLSDAARSFITIQTRMFQLFGFPLANKKKCLETLAQPPDRYLDFMSSCPSLSGDSEQHANAVVMKEAIKQACLIFKNSALQAFTPQSSIEAVEDLRRMVTNLDPNVEGSHALVWTYFVAAAESKLPEHRAFFADRLRSLFQCTEFGTIPIALETLEYIWSQQASDWTEIMFHQRPLLIM